MKNENRNQNQPMGRSAWWLDYIEGEFDSSTKVEMKSILRHSRKDQEMVTALSETKQLLKDSEQKLPELPEEFFDRIHDQIMSKVDEAEMAPAPRFQVRHYHRRWARLGTISFLSVMGFLALVSQLSHRSFDLRWDVTTQIAKQAQENPDDLALFMTYESEHDFFVDVASQSFDHLNDRNFEEQFEDLISSTHTR